MAEEDPVAVNSSVMSAVSATIPWQEGQEEDFAELREGLRRLREGETLEAESDSESEEEEDERQVAKFAQFQDTEDSEEEDEEDPGEEKPGDRLLWAAQHNKLELAKELISGSPRLVATRDSDLYTPLHRASYNNHLAMARLLLQAGADPLATTEDGWTPLHSAAKWNSAPVVELLLTCTPVNCVTRGGQTPLHLASLASTGRETIELLLTHPHTDPTLINSQGDTALDVASRNSHLSPLFDCLAPRAVRRHKE